jgi:hypothetical protein
LSPTFGQQRRPLDDREVVTASTSRDIDTAFATLMQKRADALVLSSDALFVSSRVQLAALAAHAVRLPSARMPKPAG